MTRSGTGLFARALAALMVAVVAVGCSDSGDKEDAAPVELTIPAGDQPPDLTVRFRQEATFEQVDDLAAELGTQTPPVAIASRVDYEARALYLELRDDATEAERQGLREMLLRLPIVTGLEP